jgi:hypothetical protein
VQLCHPTYLSFNFLEKLADPASGRFGLLMLSDDEQRALVTIGKQNIEQTVRGLHDRHNRYEQCDLFSE